VKFLTSVILTIVAFVLFLVSIGLILGGLMAINPQVTAWTIHAVTAIQMPAALIIPGIIFFLISLYAISKVGKPGGESNTFTFDSEKGPIHISLKAIEEYIVKHFSEEPIVHSIRPRVGTSRDHRSLRVAAAITVWSEQNLKIAGETVQREISRCLNEGLGLDNIERVRVSVDKIIKSKSSRSAPAKAPQDEL
jgi:hypothetical protein